MPESIVSTTTHQHLQTIDHGLDYVDRVLKATDGSLDPFLVLADFHMAQPSFSPHPHAGFSVMTYMFEDSTGSVVSRDSLGDYSRLEPGSVHWTQAGRGIQHEEFPETTGVDCHGVQMWINHAAADRLVPPTRHHASALDVPEAPLGPGSKARVVVGTVNGATAAFAPLVGVTVADVTLAPGAEFALESDAAARSVVLVIAGGGHVGRGHSTAVVAHDAITFEPSPAALTAQGGAQGLQLLIAEGRPFNEQTVFGGPFVMTTEAQLDDAGARYSSGGMGKLAPLS